MEEIVLKNIECYGYHGLLEEEKKEGQPFFFDVTLCGDFARAGKTDNIEDTVNYVAVFDLIVSICRNNRFNLIEALAENICSRILDNFDIVDKVKVTVKKPNAPIDGDFEYVAVNWEKERNV